jgi:hypothetical protein
MALSAICSEQSASTLITTRRQTASAVGHRAAVERAFRRWHGETDGQRFLVFRYRSTKHWVDVFRTFYGPVLKAFAALDTAGQAGLNRELIELLQCFNQG